MAIRTEIRAGIRHVGEALRDPEHLRHAIALDPGFVDATETRGATPSENAEGEMGRLPLLVHWLPRQQDARVKSLDRRLRGDGVLDKPR